MSVCTPLTPVDLGRFDRIYIEWPIDGVTEDATAAVQLNATGPWTQLVIADGFASGFFAGANFTSPAPATVVAETSHAVVRVTDGLVQVDRDGGFIRITA